MGNRDAQFNSRKGTRNCGVDISDDDDSRWSLLQKDRLNPAHYLGCLDRVGSRTDPQMDLGARDPQLLKKQPRHFLVVMLPCVDE
jgi:hypothetical protein